MLCAIRINFYGFCLCIHSFVYLFVIRWQFASLTEPDNLFDYSYVQPIKNWHNMLFVIKNSQGLSVKKKLSHNRLYFMAWVFCAIKSLLLFIHRHKNLVDIRCQRQFLVWHVDEKSKKLSCIAPV